jgi:phosphoribosylaminoimidazole-succinocarboxamide synthase
MASGSMDFIKYCDYCDYKTIPDVMLQGENMKKLEQLYEGKAKKVFATDDPDILIVDYKDDATAFNGEKRGTITGKGVINNRMTNYMFKLLQEQAGIPTHLVEEISERETIVKKSGNSAFGSHHQKRCSR